MANDSGGQNTLPLRYYQKAKSHHPSKSLYTCLFCLQNQYIHYCTQVNLILANTTCKQIFHDRDSSLAVKLYQLQQLLAFLYISTDQHLAHYFSFWPDESKQMAVLALVIIFLTDKKVLDSQCYFSHPNLTFLIFFLNS